MSIAMSHQVGSTGFALLTRLFNSMKRAGRVIDITWFQQNADYARAVLALAEKTDDATLREVIEGLRVVMREFLAPPQVAAVAVITVGPPPAEPVKADAAPAETPEPVADRYVGRLR